MIQTEKWHNGGERLLRIGEVKLRTGLSNSTIYSNIKKGLFPMPLKPSPGVSAWKESDVIALINGNWHA